MRQRNKGQRDDSILLFMVAICIVVTCLFYFMNFAGGSAIGIAQLDMERTSALRVYGQLATGQILVEYGILYILEIATLFILKADKKSTWNKKLKTN